MLSKWPIRNKLVIGLALLLVVVSALSWSAFYGLYAYRSLVKSLERVGELRVATELGQRVSDLRVGFSRLGSMALFQDFSPAPSAADTEVWTPNGGPPWALRPDSGVGMRLYRDEFRIQLASVESALHKYRAQLTRNDHSQSRIGDGRNELATVADMEATLARIQTANRDEDWMLDGIQIGCLNRELDQLQSLAGELPGYLHENIGEFTDGVRDRRRTFIALAWTTTIGTAVVLALFMHLAYKWVFRPLRLLIKGSRKVAQGNFHYRIVLDSRDEMCELAEAMNDMTRRFQAIRDDLDRQVQERTRQVVRSEQLASVGFLAAGVAHEINNPLASIAICAESLQKRAGCLLDESNPQHAVIRDYLRMIQEEAFRCKEITGKLLDFSRMGEAKRQRTELRELVQGVIDMVGHLGKYQGKHIEFLAGDFVAAPVNAQEIKQVVLNLLTNALDSVDDGGRVTVELARHGELVHLVFRDDGCGMTPEVQQHLFEPFFTRRRGGGGTGLGLSISFRIIEEHGGTIDAVSDGPGRGSEFRVTLPLTAAAEKETHHRYQAA